MIAKKVEKIGEDNIEMNLAYNEKDTVLDKDKPEVIYHIDGEEVIPLNETREYHLVDNSGIPVDLTGLTFEVNDGTLVDVSNTIQTIYLKCLIEKEVVTLVIKRDGVILAKKNIYLGEEW